MPICKLLQNSHVNVSVFSFCYVVIVVVSAFYYCYPHILLVITSYATYTTVPPYYCNYDAVGWKTLPNKLLDTTQVKWLR